MLVYRSQNPRALKNMNQGQLQIWKSNKKKKKVWVTKTLFEE